MRIVLSLFLVSAIALSTGCAITADRYQPTAVNQQVLKNLDVKMNVGNFKAKKTDYKVMCRLANNVDLPDRKSFEKYIEDALVEELTMAGMYSKNADVTINGYLNDTDVSSGFTDAHWTFDITVSSHNRVLEVEHKREYSASFVGGIACGNDMPKSLMPTVQELINKIIRHPDFESMVSTQ
ncbi:hypothetical protein [Stutzerimonas kunmingensis]|uniref:hypothetical protein n=1 Tax=Stutzerimonas kunmingensis TaxID=1211807 RepID=UPI0028AFB077|nr:hypothetical protein [Stutzerimonas kunmingensis]